MEQGRISRDIDKEPIRDKLYGDGKSALRKYQDFFVGRQSLPALLRYEFYTLLLAPLPGALGLMLRKKLVPGMLGSCGEQSLWGRDIHFRHPGNVRIGDRVAVDDHCLFDARAEGGIVLGDDTIIARDCILHAKAGRISLGERCIVGNQAQLSSTVGIQVGNDVGIGGQCYIGGGLYHTDRLDVPMLQQGLYSRGPVVIGDDVWIGAGVRVLDGVCIGKGSFIGAGAVIVEDVPEYSKVMPLQRMLVLPRGSQPSEEGQPITEARKPSSEIPRRQQVLTCIAAAIAEVNLQLPPAQRLADDEETIIFDSRSGEGLDSLSLINFVIICEQKLEEELGCVMDLSSAMTNADEVNPFASVATLAVAIGSRL